MTVGLIDSPIADEAVEPVLKEAVDDPGLLQGAAPRPRPVKKWSFLAAPIKTVSVRPNRRSRATPSARSPD